MFRKLFIVLLGPWGAMSMLAQSEVTFSVDISNVDYSGPVYVSGNTIDGWCGTCTPMSDPDGDGIYETTLYLAPGPHEFKYLLGGWNDAEFFDPSAPCTLTTGDFTNRYIDVAAGYTALPTVCYNQCVGCDFTQPVTFEVDMRRHVTGYQGVFIAGDFNGWDGMATPMFDPDGDDIWSVTLNLPLGFYNFRFVNNGTSYEFPPSECVEPVWNDRVIEVAYTDGEPMFFSACYASCEAICEPMPTAQVTFQVDMSAQVLSDEGVFMMSNINDNWYVNEYIVAMSDPDGDQIYTVTLPVSELAMFDYLFMNGNPYDGSWSSIQFYEQVEGNCDLLTSGLRHHDRTGETTEVLPVVCFGQCDASCAPTTGCMDPSACNYNPAANVAAGCTYPTPGLDCLGRCTAGGFEDQPHVLRYTEDFSSFAVGDLITEADPGRWIRWSADAGPEIDAVITEAEGDQAVRVWVDSGTGHATDVVLLLNQSEGVVDFSFDLKIAAGHGAYFNFQGTSTPGESFGPQMYIFPDGNWVLDGTNLFSLSGSGFPVDSYTYANIHFTIDLDADVLWLFIDGELIGQETFPVDLGGVDFYAHNPEGWSSDYEVDNIRLTLPALNVDLACQTPGCTYPDADNYAADATTDDGTCTFTTGGTCVGDLNYDETVSVADMLLLLGAFGTDCE